MNAESSATKESSSSPNKPQPKRFFSTKTQMRDVLIGVFGAVIAVASLIWIVSGLFGRVESRGAHGVVIGKEIIPRSETEFTLGQGGFQKREIEGRYVLRVRVAAEDKVYLVYVTENVYNQTEIGSPYFLVKEPLPTGRNGGTKESSPAESSKPAAPENR